MACGLPALTEAVASADLSSLPPRIAARWLKLTARPSADDAGRCSYVNRLVDGLGVELEEYRPAHVRAAKTYEIRCRAEA